MGANSSSGSGSSSSSSSGGASGGASGNSEREAPGSFGVRVSNSLLETNNSQPVGGAGGGSETQLTQDETAALRQQAFQQGMEYAARQLSQTQVAREASRQQDDLAALEMANDEKQRKLAATIDALHEREYRPPMQPMACAEERQNLLECYRTHRDAPAGEIVSECDRAVRALDQCALYVRQAAMAKIVPGSLPGQQ